MKIALRNNTFGFQIFAIFAVVIRMLLKRGTGSGERGAGSGERGAGSGEPGSEVWERVVGGNLHKNPKWRSKKRERERRRQRKEFVPLLKSGGNEIGNQTPILRLRFEQVVCFFDIQPVSFTIIFMIRS